MSERMGRDKSMLNYHGVAQHDYNANLIKPFCDHVFISGRPEQLANCAGYLKTGSILDQQIGAGPLRGILSAFHFDSTVAWLIMACDMPYCESSAIYHLIRHRYPLKDATCYLSPETKSPSPMPSIWEPQFARATISKIHDSTTGPRQLLRQADCQLIDCPNPTWLKSVDTQDERTIAARDISSDTDRRQLTTN